MCLSGRSKSESCSLKGESSSLILYIYTGASYTCGLLYIKASAYKIKDCTHTMNLSLPLPHFCICHEYNGVAINLANSLISILDL